MKEEILFDWNPFWTGEFEFEFVKRDLWKKIKKWVDRREIIPITGARRSGKTTMMHIVIKKLLEEVPKENILFIKCDDERVKEPIIEKAREKQNELFNPEGRIYLFLDEVQEAKNWEKTVKRIYDLEKNVKIFLSGSQLLKRKLSTALAGRFIYFSVYPFSFREFLRAKGIKAKEKTEMVSKKDEIKHYLREYLEWGGFPEVALEENEERKKRLLRFYSDTILYRDVVKSSGISKVDKIEKLKDYILANISNLFNYSKIAERLGIASGTVASYMNALEEAYYLFPVKTFSYSLKKQQVNPKKIYCIDNGIRNVVGFRFSRDAGRLYENLVFLGLKRKGKEIYYWKGKGKEVDFLIKEGENIKKAIQVCYDIGKAKDREVEALIEALDNFDLERGLIITESTEGEEEIKGKKVRYIPLWKWLLYG